MDALNISNASVVGNSLGGLLALATTLQHPSRFKRLVLESSAGLGREIAWFLRLITLPVVGEVLTVANRRLIRHFLRSIFHNQSFCTDSLIDELYRIRRLSGNKQSLLSMLRSGVSLLGVSPDILLTDRLNLIDNSVLLIWGQNDLIFPVAHAKQAVPIFPNARLEIFDNCGHWPHVEACNKFNLLVSEFCAA